MDIRYHLRDWLIDWAAMLEQSSVVPKERQSDAIREHFLSRYHSIEEAKWRSRRIGAAMVYLETNASSFEQAGYALASSKGGTVSKYLTSALYRFFGVATDAEVAQPPPVADFIEAAAEHERNDP